MEQDPYYIPRECRRQERLCKRIWCANYSGSHFDIWMKNRGDLDDDVDDDQSGFNLYLG